VDGVVGPESIHRSGPYPFLQGIFNFRKVDIQVVRGAEDGDASAGRTAGRGQIGGIQELAAGFALVAPGVRIAAVGTDPADETVGKEPVACGAMQLLYGAFEYKAPIVQFIEDILDYFRLDRGRSPPEFIEIDIEPAVDSRMQGMVAIAQFLGRYTLFARPGFGRGAVFIGPAHV